jgi:hypothetical protein
MEVIRQTEEEAYRARRSSKDTAWWRRLMGW